MPLRPELRNIQNGKAPKILILGSGGLSIGQAGEFDYSGTQALKAVKEEGFEVIIVNPNIATVQTNPEAGVKTYLYPVTPEWVEKIFELERPTAIIAGFGGQTALNCLLDLDERGILKKYGVVNLGTPPETLRMTEDRDLFAKKMNQIGIPIPESIATSSLDEAVAAANRIGYPVIVRAAYALGGLGSGFANNDLELKTLVVPALVTSPQVLVEKSLKGWKEVEYEVMRDCEGNVITICNMENFDPLGIHTGDSIVVCPSQSLSDDEYQLLRNAAVKMIGSMGIVGECNAQFALCPNSLNYYVIEVNARLSRSSALASKASGYPIAYIAAKVVLGYDLLELKNPVTGVTCAFYEPALDYVTVKVPRWDLGKFKGANRELGSTMKSVGEIMSIGRTFPEALQKAVRMISENGEGLSWFTKALPEKELQEQLSVPTDTRLYAVLQAFRQGFGIERIHSETKIDKWFLSEVANIISMELKIENLATNYKGAIENIASLVEGVDGAGWRQWKLLGFGDEQIAGLLIKKAFGSAKESETRLVSMKLRALRLEKGVYPVVKKIDTTAGEYPSPSNYLYMTYAGTFHDDVSRDERPSAIVLGGGSYRIGTSVEFDWCAVSSSRCLQKAGWCSIIINCNPETVSTDYNSSDRLYFEELTLERILDIVDFEKPKGVISSMGGQLPNKLAIPLAANGVNLLGHSPETVDNSEDRSKFSALLDTIGVEQPEWVAARTREDIDRFIERIGFPVLVRPSYVLSGAAMRVAYDRASLDRFLSAAADISSDHPVVISQFLLGACEIEIDGVAQNGEVITSIVSEHIENAGIHSGDATMVVPAQRLYVETVRQVKRAARLIAAGLKLNGPFNIQFLAQNNHVKVIECNARAARSFPFISKTVGLNLAEVATSVMIGVKPRVKRHIEDELPHVGVKAAMFSFTRLRGADPILGVEMASTGEVGCIGHTFEEALLLSLEASKVTAPKKGVLVSAGAEMEKFRFLESAKIFQDLGLPLFATPGTASYLESHNIKVTSVSWLESDSPNVLEIIRKGLVDLVLNIPKDDRTEELTKGAQVRQAAVQFGLPLLTNMEKITAFARALNALPEFGVRHKVACLPQYQV
ncbi:MAG: carbamoyl-phosphate synthase (glutamine-hydrolyzing) large subunit [Pseudomonadota bacterium]